MPSRHRSALMARVRGKDTKPELIVRRAVHAMGFRFRLHRRNLPGCPDLVFSSRRKAIFVHGCFWHRHPGCRKASTPKTRVGFWQDKLDRNVRRDAAAIEALTAGGWEVLVIWECETHAGDLETRLERFLGRRIHGDGQSRQSQSPGSTHDGRAPQMFTLAGHDPIGTAASHVSPLKNPDRAF